MQTIHLNNDTRVSITPGFVWDRQGAYLFDIDGTLLRSRDRVHMDSVAIAVRRTMGIEVSLDGVPVQGSTDTAIVRDACRQAGVQEEELEPQIAAIREAMCANVRERRSELNLYLMPGVHKTLEHLARRGALLGVATGNLETIGWMKLETIGLREWFRFGGFSDHFPVRAELIGKAAEKARALAGADATVCVVGDTPRDIAAARANNLPVIAVATGHSHYEELMALEPEVCASSLAALLAVTQVEP
jgi:phosphoglycolate phosphatase